MILEAAELLFLTVVGLRFRSFNFATTVNEWDFIIPLFVADPNTTGSQSRESNSPIDERAEVSAQSLITDAMKTPTS